MFYNRYEKARVGSGAWYLRYQYREDNSTAVGLLVWAIKRYKIHRMYSPRTSQIYMTFSRKYIA